MSGGGAPATGPVTLVWAQNTAGAIGRHNTLPWRIPEDLRRFRQLTNGHPVVMGRKTWESLPARFRPLPGRENIVLSRTDSPLDGATVLSSLAAALGRAGTGGLSVIGGGEIYRAALPFATRLCVTEVDLDVTDADTFAPEISGDEWAVTETGEWQTSTAGPRFRFVDYSRR